MTTYKFLIIEDDDSDFSRLKQLLDDYASDNHIDFKILGAILVKNLITI